MKFGLIDYGRGNLRSVEKALERVGASVTRIDSPEKWEALAPAAIILPGVGAFGDAMANLRERNLVTPLRDWVKADLPFFGICLGYQLLFESSEESPGVEGLSVIEGRVVRFPSSVKKVPHMGWNQVIPRRFPGNLFPASGTPYFYHVHSYYPVGLEEEHIASETEYDSIKFASGAHRGNLHAFQFHPEKSQENGRKLLQAFVDQVTRKACVPA